MIAVVGGCEALGSWSHQKAVTLNHDGYVNSSSSVSNINHMAEIVLTIPLQKCLDSNYCRSHGSCFQVSIFQRILSGVKGGQFFLFSPAGAIIFLSHILCDFTLLAYVLFDKSSPVKRRENNTLDTIFLC